MGIEGRNRGIGGEPSENPNATVLGRTIELQDFLTKQGSHWSSLTTRVSVFRYFVKLQQLVFEEKRARSSTINYKQLQSMSGSFSEEARKSSQDFEDTAERRGEFGKKEEERRKDPEYMSAYLEIKQRADSLQLAFIRESGNTLDGISFKRDTSFLDALQGIQQFISIPQKKIKDI